jgi:hypothetical protein
VASAYGWVTIEILSMVKRAHPLYSNNLYMYVVPRQNLLKEYTGSRLKFSSCLFFIFNINDASPFLPMDFIFIFTSCQDIIGSLWVT